MSEFWVIWNFISTIEAESWLFVPIFFYALKILVSGGNKIGEHGQEHPSNSMGDNMGD